MTMRQNPARGLTGLAAAATETTGDGAEQDSADRPNEHDTHGTEQNDAESLRDVDQG